MDRTDTTRREIEEREEAGLAPFALRSSRAARLLRLDPEGRLFDYRTEYQRDRDRILHARAFRRLRLKSDGGAVGAGERRRDRLTHTLEVAQIARTIARSLALNEDLAEAIALGHAVGSPPFGRDGARGLDEITTIGGRSLPGGFQVHLHSLRVLDLLEKRYEHPGLNLTVDVREGIVLQSGPCGGAPPLAAPASTKAGSILDGLDLGTLGAGPSPSFEAQSVAVADRIASVLGDLDDLFRAGDIEPAEAERWPLVRELIRRVGQRYPAASRGRRAMKANVLHRGLTHLLVTGTIHQARRSLRAWCRLAGVEDHESFLARRETLPGRAIEMGPRSQRLFEDLRASVEDRARSTAGSALAAARARRILSDLIEAYHIDPRLLDDYVLLRFKEIAGGAYLRDLPAAAMETEIARRYHGSGVFLRLIADHIAGMTDAYALSEHGRLSGAAPSTGGIPPLP